MAHTLMGVAPRSAEPAFEGLLRRAALHEFYPATQRDAMASTGLLLGLATQQQEGLILWVRQEALSRECGQSSPSGLVEFGVDPRRVVLIRARDAQVVLQAGLEGARSGGLAAVLLESWGDMSLYDLSASRRLALAARESGARVLLAPVAAPVKASAAETRWRVQASPSAPLVTRAPGPPVFNLSLLRARNGRDGTTYRLEWNRDARSFMPCDDISRAQSRSPGRHSAALSGALAPLPANGSDGAAPPFFRQAG
jgi:protein ImuA